jgi:dynein heavy chain 1
MGRIFVGLCQCGAWGCFDEFNRLEERILSAVSQQILTIQVGLRESRTTISLLEKAVKLDPRVGLFITMNPGYAGRSELPDNLKQLFRGMAMVQADRLLIGQVMLFAQGFRTAEDLSSKVGLLFQLCEAQLSSRSHYDFGLRALKSVLRSAGNLKRAFIARAAAATIRDEEKSKEMAENDESAAKVKDEAKRTPQEEEQDLLVKSICATISPKLVSADLSLFSTLVRAVFPGAHLHTANIPALRDVISKLCASSDHSLEDGQLWVDKIMQLNEISTIHHGVIMVGPASTGQ